MNDSNQEANCFRKILETSDENRKENEKCAEKDSRVKRNMWSADEMKKNLLFCRFFPADLATWFALLIQLESRGLCSIVYFNQSIDQLISRSMNQSFKQWINQSINRLIELQFVVNLYFMPANRWRDTEIPLTLLFLFADCLSIGLLSTQFILRKKTNKINLTEFEIKNEIIRLLTLIYRGRPGRPGLQWPLRGNFP